MGSPHYSGFSMLTLGNAGLRPQFDFNASLLLFPLSGGLFRSCSCSCYRLPLTRLVARLTDSTCALILIAHVYSATPRHSIPNASQKLDSSVWNRAQSRGHGPSDHGGRYRQLPRVHRLLTRVFVHTSVRLHALFLSSCCSYCCQMF
jgi:hypothetical protein